MSNDHPIKFAAIGLAHNHVYDMTRRLMAAGAELVACWDDEPGNLAAFAGAFPHAATTRGANEVLQDEVINLIVSAAIHDERAALGVRAMQHGKDFFCTKPGFTTLAQLDAVRRACATTGRRRRS